MSNNIHNSKGTRREDWGTPQWLFEALDGIFNFKIDLAANIDNAKLPNYVSPAFDFLSMSLHGLRTLFPAVFLEQEWCWCNPPYGRNGCGKWMKQIFTVPNTVSLVPASVGSKWFKICWDEADVIVFFHGRLQYEGAPTGAQFDSCLVIKGDIISKQQMRELSLLGRVIPLENTLKYCDGVTI